MRELFHTSNLIKTGNSDRIPSVLELQRAEIGKAIDMGNEKTGLYQMLLPYVEYKERAAMIPKIQEVLNKWMTKVNEIADIFKKLEHDPASVGLDAISK